MHTETTRSSGYWLGTVLLLYLLRTDYCVHLVLFMIRHNNNVVIPGNCRIPTTASASDAVASHRVQPCCAITARLLLSRGCPA
jgi:hypothetical protein